MAAKKSSKTPLGEKAGDFARNIWLAGLGAYGESYDDFKNTPSSVSDLPKLFQELVEKGASIESSDDKKRSTRMSTTKSENFEQRIKRMRDNFNLGWPGMETGGNAEQLDRIEQKLDALAKDVDSIKKQLGGSKAKKAPAKKAAAKKKSAAK